MKELFVLSFLLYTTFLHGQEASLLMEKGIEAYGAGDYKGAIEFFSRCSEQARIENNAQLRGRALNNLGNTYSQTGRSEESLLSFQKALDVFEADSDSLNMAKALKNIGALYAERKDFEQARDYYSKALDFALRTGDEPLRADCLNNLGVVYEQEGSLDSALMSYSEALSIYRTQRDTGRLAMTFNNLGVVFKTTGRLAEAILSYDSAAFYASHLGDQFLEAALINNTGNVYALLGDHRRSLEHCLRAYEMALEGGFNDVVIEAAEGISTAYENLGKLTEALMYRKIYEEKREAFVNEESAAQLASFRVQYETEKKEAEIRLLQSQSLVKELQLDRSKRLTWALLAVLLALAPAGFFWRSRQRLRAAIALDAAVRKTEEQERLRLARDIHDDLGSGLSKLNFLSELIAKKTSDLPEVQKHSTSVQETARRMIENMRDLIWALNPENTHLPNLIARIREYASEYFEEISITASFEIPEVIPDSPVSKEGHRHIMLAVKEAVNNIGKHSGAKSVRVAISVSEELSISIADDGTGIRESASKGNGLRNMRTRMEAIEGTVEVNPVANGGTEVRFIIPMKALSITPSIPLK